MNPFDAAKAPSPEGLAPQKKSSEIVVMPDKYLGVALKMDARELDEKKTANPLPTPPPPPRPKPVMSSVPTDEKSFPWAYVSLGLVVFILISGGFVYFNRETLFKKTPVVVTPTPTSTQQEVKTPPATPTSLTATAASGTQAVQLRWIDASNNESGFKIERAGTDKLFASLTNLPMNSTSFLDVSVAAGATYSYRIVALNEAGVSAPTAESTVSISSAAISSPVATLPPGGLDTDSDGLSDAEEAALRSDVRNPDTDKDGFLDGNEVFHLYNPSTQTPVKLVDTNLVKAFKGSLGWSLIVPTSWTTNLNVADGQKATISTGQGESFIIEVMSDDQERTAVEWYLNKHSTTTRDQLRELTTKQGLQGVLSPDRLQAVFRWGKNVFLFTYIQGNKPYINYRTIYEMMLNSLKLEGAPTVASMLQDASLSGPGDVVGVTATSTSTAPTSTQLQLNTTTTTTTTTATSTNSATTSTTATSTTP